MLCSTDDPTYGQQQLSFFNGGYDQHMYHPLLLHLQDALLDWFVKRGEGEFSQRLRVGCDPRGAPSG
jgi:hypothetical protein